MVRTNLPDTYCDPIPVELAKMLINVSAGCICVSFEINGPYSGTGVYSHFYDSITLMLFNTGRIAAGLCRKLSASTTYPLIPAFWLQRGPKPKLLLSTIISNT